jgi:hypothetical protein
VSATADFVFNIARGASHYYYYAVKQSLVVTATGTPPFTSAADSALIVVAINAGGETDPVLRDYDTLDALLVAANPAEVTNTNYARKVLTDTELAAVPAPDDTNERYELDIPDQTWTAVAAGTAWTDLLVCFRPNAAAADTAIIPLTCHDFAVTPDGSDITAQIAATGFYRSA